MLYKCLHDLNTKRLFPSLIAVVVFASSNKSFLFCGLYAVFVFAGQHFMRERQKLNLRRPLVLWSLSLAIFRWDMTTLIPCPLSKGYVFKEKKNNTESQGLYGKYRCSVSWYHVSSPVMAPNPRTSSYIAITKPLVPLMCSLCSILGALRTGFYMMNVINTKGFSGSVCDNSFYSAPVSKFWAYAFVLSKAPELGESSSFSKSSSKCPHSFEHVQCNNSGSQDKTIKFEQSPSTKSCLHMHMNLRHRFTYDLSVQAIKTAWSTVWCPGLVQIQLVHNAFANVYETRKIKDTLYCMFNLWRKATLQSKQQDWLIILPFGYNNAGDWLFIKRECAQPFAIPEFSIQSDLGALV